MLRAVLFDLDGTLLDTTEFIFQAYEHTFETYGFRVVPRKELTNHIGRGLKVIYGNFAPTGDVVAMMETHDKFQSKNFHLVKVYPKIEEVVKKIKKMGFKVGIVTSRRHNTRDAMKSGGLDPKLFDVIITSVEIKNLKPAPDGVLLALKKLKLKPEEAILIGDATVDIEMGKNAGVKTVGVTYGFGGKKIKISKPDYIIDNIEQVLKIL